MKFTYTDRVEKGSVMGDNIPLIKEAVFDYGIMRLGSVIHILRKQGYNIKTNMTTGKNRFEKSVTFATYTMGDTNNE